MRLRAVAPSRSPPASDVGKAMGDCVSFRSLLADGDELRREPLDLPTRLSNATRSSSLDRPL